MNEAIVAVIITGMFSLAGSIITALVTSSKTRAEMQKNQAVMNERISELTREVREHNNFARRMPVVEEQIRVANHRIKELEGLHKREG